MKEYRIFRDRRDGASHPEAPRSGAPDGRPSLPCLNSNNSTELALERSLKTLSTGHRKTAFALKENVHRLANKYGVERIAFFTPTFADHVTCPKEAGRRFNSLNVHVLSKRYAETICVLERMKSGRIHFHLLLVLPVDIRTGFSFEEAGKGIYTSANNYLRAEWAFWRQTAKKYGFGRCEMLPVKSTGEAVAKYVGKYISKHIGARQHRDKGVRLVRYARGAKFTGNNFMFHSQRAGLWRHLLSVFATKHGATSDNYPQVLTAKFGKRWAHTQRDAIMKTRPTVSWLEDLWEVDRIRLCKNVSDAIGCTQGDAYLTLCQEGVFKRPSLEFSVPRFRPPPEIKKIESCLEVMVIYSDGRIEKGAGVKFTPDKPRTEVAAVVVAE